MMNTTLLNSSYQLPYRFQKLTRPLSVHLRSPKHEPSEEPLLDREDDEDHRVTNLTIKNSYSQPIDEIEVSNQQGSKHDQLQIWKQSEKM